MGRFPLDRLAIGLGKIFEVDRARTLSHGPIKSPVVAPSAMMTRTGAGLRWLTMQPAGPGCSISIAECLII
jgi:hypothetical protein